MELTETERLMLIKKKEEICGLTLQILDMAHDRERELEIKKNFTTILSLLNQIASYSDSKNYDLNEFTEYVDALFGLMSHEKSSESWSPLRVKIWLVSPVVIEKLCNYANSVRFDFTKKGLKINFPKIDISIFRIK
jgi:hypothetical protein